MARIGNFQTVTRESYIPKGAMKVSHKASDAVVYLYQSERGRLAAIAFHGRAAKPDWHHTFASAESRAAMVRRFFEGRARTLAVRAEQRAKRQIPHTLELGHILYATWGYEQTNVNFYQVTRLVGRHTVELREVARISQDGEAWATGKAMPKLDAFIGEPIRRRVNGKSVRINTSQWASLWNGNAVSWTAYA